MAGCAHHPGPPIKNAARLPWYPRACRVAASEARASAWLATGGRRPSRSPGQMHARPQPALRGGFAPDVAAMAARHVARDRQSQPDAAGLRIARRIEANERLKDMVALGG